jgi:hypothetical protein
MSYAQNASAFHLSVCFTGIFLLLVMGKGRSAIPTVNHCSSELQLSQSLPVVLYMGAR